MGPMAGVRLHEHVIKKTHADRGDASHFDVLHYSWPSQVPDRSRFLLTGAGQNPADAVFDLFKARHSLSSAPSILGIPCSSFHAPSIWKRFVELTGGLEGIRILNMVEETVNVIATGKRVRRVGVISTWGTRKSGTYREPLLGRGVEVVEVPEPLQDEQHDCIYNREWGLKAVSPPTPRALETLHRHCRILADGGVDLILLGCSEVSSAFSGEHFAGVRLIDPIQILADGLIRSASQ